MLGAFCYSKYNLTIIDQRERLTSILSERKEEYSQAIKNSLPHLIEKEFNMHSKGDSDAETAGMLSTTSTCAFVELVLNCPTLIITSIDHIFTT